MGTGSENIYRNPQRLCSALIAYCRMILKEQKYEYSENEIVV